MNQDKIVERFSIYLKNVIFFKFVIYCLFIGLLIWLLQIFQEDLASSVKWLNRANGSLNKAIAKLSAITDSEDKMLETYKQYEEILTISDRKRCDRRMKLVGDLRKLENKYGLSDPIDIRISQSFLKNHERFVRDRIKVKSYDIKTTFFSSNLDMALSLMREAYALAPSNPVMISIRIQKKEIITPELIPKLSVAKYPDLLKTEFGIRVREIVVEKR